MSEEIEKWHDGWTRRRLLTRIGQIGGASALYETMVAMGLINVPPAWAGTPKMPEGNGVGKSVLILGAGIGGLTTAYILSRYGYSCRILEATHRAGGRNHTARRGSTILENSNEHGSTSQQCRFDDGLYLNLGPGRLAYHHPRMLGYCQELEVELEPYIANTSGNLYQTSLAFDQKPVIYGEVQNDTRGYIAEILAKSVSQGMLNTALDAEDRVRLLSLLGKFGALDEDYKYDGSGGRAGCGPDTPNVFYGCQILPPTPLDQLLDSKFWEDNFYQEFDYRHQATLFQPVGGMDMIVEGFLRKVGNLITYSAPVVGIETRDDGVSVKYMNGATQATATADYCVSNIPCPVLEKISANFSDDYRDAIRRTEFGTGCKVGWQSNTRFWESNKYGIFGGISWTNDIISQIWYPSNGYFTQKGTLTGAYIQLDNATEFGKLSLEKRLEVAKSGGAKLHPEILEERIVPTKLGLSIAWQNVPYQEGAWPNWESPISWNPGHVPGDTSGDSHDEDDKDYRRLLLPDGRFHIVGDQTSTLPGWQEGAMMSAEWVVELIAGSKGPEDIPADCKAPSTSRVLHHG